MTRLALRHEALSLRALVDAEIDRLPSPGGGRTLDRWRTLGRVAHIDLSLVKLFEGHTDALAILAELRGAAAPEGSLWGTWCAEPPSARVAVTPVGRAGEMAMNGTKAWCSGAAQVTHAIVSAWNPDGEPCLVAVALDQPGVHVSDNGWEAVGMQDSGSVDVQFVDAIATAVGHAGDYVARPGFWQGGAGIAACWFGGAVAIADVVREGTRASDVHRLAHLGAIDVALTAAAATLREAAVWIDANPHANAMGVTTRTRLVVEAACTEVIARAGRAVGAGPLCRDARFARAMADLPVYLRQSHAERDLASLGESIMKNPESPWML